MWHSRPPRDPPPFMANTNLNFHFDYLNPSLSGFLKEPSYETTSWCESVLSWPEVLRALGQNVKIIGGWADGDGDHQPATT